MTRLPLSSPLVLASSSPRRRQLLSESGYQFTVLPPHESAESPAAHAESPPELVSRLAYQKAHVVAPQVERGLIIGCDTVAECSRRILGKPKNREDARRMLMLLRGQEHRVYSGLCLWRRPDDQHRVETDV